MSRQWFINGAKRSSHSYRKEFQSTAALLENHRTERIVSVQWPQGLSAKGSSLGLVECGQILSSVKETWSRRVRSGDRVLEFHLKVNAQEEAKLIVQKTP